MRGGRICGISGSSLTLAVVVWQGEKRRRHMQAKIHPEYKDATITCACGEVIKTRSTKPEIKVEICSKCHPFFTGKQKLLDTAGRIEKFNKRYAKVIRKKA